MKVILIATEDVNRTYGTLQIEAKEGEKKELSPSHAEIYMHTGSFRLADQVAENEADEKLAEAQQADQDAKKAELMKLGKDVLVESAKDLPGYKTSMNKEELVDLILTPRPPVTDGDGEGDAA